MFFAADNGLGLVVNNGPYSCIVTHVAIPQVVLLAVMYGELCVGRVALE